MKIKNLFGMFAMASMLLATSCSQDEAISNGAAGEFANATFTIGTADALGTRAIGDGTTVDKVECAVFDAEGKEMENLRKTVEIKGKTATYEVRLAKGQNYRVAFFAFNEAAAAYDVTDMKNIEVKAGQNCNAEDRDAFTAFVDVKVGETMNAIEKDVTLYRPFAQLNLGIDDEELQAAANAGISISKSKIIVSNVYNAFSAYDDAVVATNNAASMEFAMRKTPVEKLKVDADLDGTDEEYNYLALNYLLVGNKGSEKTLTDVEFIWETEDGKTNNPTTTFLNIPVQRNYRTNILGKLLTNPAKFNITIDERFEKPDYIINEGGENGEPTTFYANVATVDELQDAINAAVAGTTIINFTQDIEANGLEVWIVQAKNKEIVIDGADKGFNGTFKVHSNSNRANDGNVTFKDINFTAKADGMSCIEATDFGSGKRYSQNITIMGCDFAAEDAALNTAVAVKVNATQNLNISNCTSTNMHSFMQAQSCDKNIVVDNVTVNGKNGIAFGNTAEPTVLNSTITATGYGIRADGNASRGNLIVKNNTIIANLPIVVRKVTTSTYNVSLEGENTLTAGQTYEVIFTNGDDGEFVAPTGAYTISGAESFNVYPAAAGEPKVANTAAKFKEFLADASIAEIQLGEGAVIEGAFTVNRAVAIKSVSATNKATIKGRVDISGDASFENVKFDINDASKVKNAFSGANYKYPSTANIYAAAATFEGCEFATDLASGVCGINYGSHVAGKMLTVNNCKFKGDFYAIRSRTLFSVTNSFFDIYTTAGTLAAVFTWGNGNSGANSVTFTNNTNMNSNVVYGVQLTSTTFTYDNININVQDNTDFEVLSNSVNPACTFTGCTFAAGSETFEF